MSTFEKVNIVGVMSGTSLDGLDIALCEFEKKDDQWLYKIFDARTVSYPKEWAQKLPALMTVSAVEYAQADQNYGVYIGKQVKKFLDDLGYDTDLVASHGHTIFHQPEKGFTTQIGHGAHIAGQTGLPVVSDFRTNDVALGGQGAPLVPIGDQLLFSQYDFCLNLGGIANISCQKDNKRIAFDICPVNIVLNYYAAKAGKIYDDYGKMASFGKMHEPLMKELNTLDFYTQPFPKSLGREWIDMHVIPLCEKYKLSEEDALCTFCHHIAFQLNSTIKQLRTDDTQKTLFITGGGAFNDFLVRLIRLYCGENIKVIIPEALIVMFKEALVFAFLGLLRVMNQNNSLASVTGASHDNIGGALFGNFSKIGTRKAEEEKPLH